MIASVREVARLAGVRVTASGPSVAATTLTPGFTLRPGESGRAGIERLLARTPDLVVGRGAELIVQEPDPDAVASHAYGDTHPVSAITEQTPEAHLAAVRVLGFGAVGSAVSEAVADGTSGARVVTVLDEGLTTAEQAEDRALATLRRDVLARSLAVLEAAPHPGQEPGDVVAVPDESLGLDETRLRVQTVHIEFSRSPRGRYLMRLELGTP